MEAVVRKQTSFRLREDLLQVLQEHAKKANRSLNNFVESTLMDAMYSEPNEETVAAIKEARETKGQPTAIIAKTVKGKGVSFMENQAGWHGKAPNDEEYKIAMEDLEKAGEALCQK